MSSRTMIGCIFVYARLNL